MKANFNVLILEDLSTDAELAKKELKKIFKRLVFKVVDTEDEYTEALEKFNPDLIIADYKLPTFDGLSALKIKQKISPFTPFVVLTGSQNEDIAVDCLKAGADDYVIKEHIKRLCPAVLNAIEKNKIELENRQLKESEAHYRYLFDSLPYGGEVLDLKGNIKDCSPKTAQMLGYKKEEMLGKHITNFLDEDSVEIFKEKYPRILNGESVKVEIQMVHKNGSQLNILRAAQPIYNKNNEIETVMALNIDITDRKQAEAALKSSEERLKIIFEYAPDAIYIADLKGNFLDGNKMAEGLTGYDKEELIGENFLNTGLLTKKDLPKAVKLLAKNLLGKRTGPDEFLVNHKDGSQISLEISNFPVKIKGRTVILGVARDITERKKTEKEILRLKDGLEVEVAEKTKELNEKVDHLQRFFDATVDRELRMKELSDENEKLKAELKKK